MKRGRWQWVGLVCLVACSRSNDPLPNKNTNWMRVCDSADDCGAGQSCLCGTCTTTCGAASECDRDGVEASCVPIVDPRIEAQCAANDPGDAVAICAAACEGTADCAAIGPELACSQAVCVQSAFAALDAGLEAGMSGPDAATPPGAPDAEVADAMVDAATDECKNSALNDCADNATCVNTPGSYECKCLPPFAGDDPAHCYCDMSGYWALRQDLDTCWCDRDLLDVTIVSKGQFEASVWELHRYTYDGEVLKVEKGGCGADNGPDLISPFFGETYSSYIPDQVLAEAGLAKGVDVPEAAIVPGRSFITPNEGVVTGIDLGDNPNCSSCFPTNTTQVNEAGGPAPSWVDFEDDGEPGLTLWPRLPSQQTDGSRPGDTVYYNYLPVNLDSESKVTHRAGCVSVATRFITRLEADVQTCDRIVGEVIQVRAEGRVHSCTLVPPDKWDDDISCDAEDWSEAEPCSADDVQRLDEQNQDQTSKARFELVKIGDLRDTISCADVRDALPAVSRSTPTPIACDCR